MIVDYGFSLTGKSHVSRGICCQDSHRILKMENGWYIAAIADGVGSAPNSHIGSKIAVDSVVALCNECMPWDYNIISIKSMMRTAYNYAYKRILKEAQKNNNPVESYDTTLSMVIYDGHRVIYGHSGDGAIIGLTTFGDFIEITKPQKGDDGITVVPLRAGYTHWVIDVYEEELAAVLLMTDGMLETLCPYLLRFAGSQGNRIYAPLGAFFADPKGFVGSLEDQKLSNKYIEEFLAASDEYDAEHFYSRLAIIYKAHISNDADNIISELKQNNYPVALMQAQQDDKTLVGLINTDMPLDDKTKEFYAEPDWNALQDAWNRKAYPHLYVDPEVLQEEVAASLPDEQAGASEGTETSEKQCDYAGSDSSAIVKNETAEDKRDSNQVSGDQNEKQTAGDLMKQEEMTSQPMAPTHERPRKKSLIDKIGDFLDS